MSYMALNYDIAKPTVVPVIPAAVIEVVYADIVKLSY